MLVRCNTTLCWTLTAGASAKAETGWYSNPFPVFTTLKVKWVPSPGVRRRRYTTPWLLVLLWTQPPGSISTSPDSTLLTISTMCSKYCSSLARVVMASSSLVLSSSHCFTAKDVARHALRIVSQASSPRKSSAIFSSALLIIPMDSASRFSGCVWSGTLSPASMQWSANMSRNPGLCHTHRVALAVTSFQSTASSGASSFLPSTRFTPFLTVCFSRDFADVSFGTCASAASVSKLTAYLLSWAEMALSVAPLMAAIQPSTSP
mmetsp:Transcript_80854/g.142508  ORF Transcript_80854/g.142508 Transcript_80854/m.142508 type:complete len:262 (+) Transcript_80854:418-1203(+)